MQGLEFDDVFLLDFFADSPATAEWRVLLSYLEELSGQDDGDLKASQLRTVDASCHVLGFMQSVGSLSAAEPP